MSENTYSYGASIQGDVSLEPVGDSTLLSKLRERVSAKVKRPEILVDVPERPGVSLRVSPNITQQQMKAWRKNAGEDTKNGLDGTLFACYVVAHTTTGFFVDDEEVTADNGTSLTFGSTEVRNMTNTTRAIPDAVLAFFGIDPHVESAALAIMEKAGYADVVEATDPTKNS